MRAVGALLFLAAGLAAAHCVKRSFDQPRPRDLVYAAAAPACAIVAVIGLILAFVPEFLS